MESPIVPPRTVRLPLAEDAWLDVKDCLNHGETQALYLELYRTMPDGELSRRNPLETGDALILAFLVDWSFAEWLPIRGRGPEELRAALAGIYQDVYLDIKEAIEGHADRVTAARHEKKRIRRGALESVPT